MLFIPYLKRRLEQEDWTIRWFHVFQGPLLLRRGPVPEKPREADATFVQDYYRGHVTREELEEASVNTENNRNDLESTTKEANASSKEAPSPSSSFGQIRNPAEERGEIAPGPWYTPANLLAKAKYYFFRGVNQDPASEQLKPKGGFLTGDLKSMHARTTHFDNKTEYLYSFLQVLTAATSSFAHGANDVSNAMGPLSAIYLIWSSGTLSSKADVPIWVLLFGGASIVLGLWTYGYHIMRNLGNRLTLHSPSRGFSMELGAALTVVMATRLGLPISTTQCIVGATVGVGLCQGELKAINWRMVGWIYFGWFITLPVTGIIAGCLMGIIINAPQWGNAL